MQNNDKGANNYTKYTPPWLTSPHSKLKQSLSELTNNLILWFDAPSAAPSEEVWGIGLLHEDLFQGAFSRSGSRVSSQHKEIKRQDAEVMQLLTLGVSIAACAAGHSCRVGLWRHWVKRTKHQGSKLEHRIQAPKLTSPWSKKNTNSYFHSAPSTKILLILLQ